MRSKSTTLFGTTILAAALALSPAAVSAQYEDENTLTEIGQSIQDIGRAWEDAADDTEEELDYYEDTYEDAYWDTTPDDRTARYSRGDYYRYDDDYYEDREDYLDDYYDEREEYYEDREDALDEFDDYEDREAFFRERERRFQQDNRERWRRADQDIDRKHQEYHDHLWERERAAETAAEHQEIDREHQLKHQDYREQQRDINEEYRERQQAGYDYYSDDWYDNDRDFDSWYDEI